MKTIVILAVLLASLLVVTAAAFGGLPTCATYCPDQTCYKVMGNDLDNSANSFTQDWTFCFDGNNFGWVCSVNTATPPLLFLSLYPEGLNDQAVSLDSSSHGGYMTFHGPWDGAFNGLYYDGTDRFKIHGVAEGCVD